MLAMSNLREVIADMLDGQEGAYDTNAIADDVYDHTGTFNLDDADPDTVWAIVARHDLAG